MVITIWYKVSILVLAKIAQEDAVPYIIAEIPTNPRVEVPDLIKLKDILSEKRQNTIR